MERRGDISQLAGPLAANGGAWEQWHRQTRTELSFRVLVVCDPGNLEERLRKTARTLGEEIAFARSFGEGLELVRQRLFDIVVLAKTLGEGEGQLSPREFVHEVKRLNEQAVLMVVAPSSAFERLIDVMVEGVYDFLPDDADDHQLKLTMGRVADHARLRRRSDELEHVLDLQNSVLRQRLQELALLNEMSHDLGSVPDLDEVLRRALRRILEAFGSRCGSFLILDAETGDLVVRAAAGPGAEKRLGQHRKLGEGVSGKVALERNPVLVTDVEKDSRFKDLELAHRDGQAYRSASFIAVPLIHHDQLLGEMNVTEKETGEPFTADDLRLLSILGGHVASAVSGALAAEELKKLNAALHEKMCSARESLRAAHERLTRAEGLTCAVASTMPAALAVLDPGLCVTFANEAARELLGLAQGDCLEGLAAPSDLAGLAKAAAEVVRQGCTRKLTAECGGDGQSGGRLRIVVTPLRLPDGSVSGAAVVAMAARCPLLGDALDQGT